MTYYNYFESCRKTKKDNPFLSTASVVKMIAFLAVAFIVVWLGQRYIIGKYNNAVDLIAKTQKDPALLKQIEVSDQLTKTLERVNKEVSFMDNVGKGMVSMNTVNNALFKSIHSCFTEEVLISKIEVNALSIVIEGRCTNITQLSDAERAFMATGYYSAVHVEKITGSGITEGENKNEDITFTCLLTLKGRSVPDEQQE